MINILFPLILTVIVAAVIILAELLREKLEIDGKYIIGIIAFVLFLVVIYVFWKLVFTDMPRCLPR